MYDESAEIEIFRTGKEHLLAAGELQVIEYSMMQDDKYRKRDLQFPVLVGNEDGAADKGKKMHFKKAMHLVDILRHKDRDHQAQHILIQVGIREEELDGIIGRQAQPAHAQGNGPGIECGCKSQPGQEKTSQEEIHQPVRSSFNFQNVIGRLLVQTSVGRYGVKDVFHWVQVGSVQP